MMSEYERAVEIVETYMDAMSKNDYARVMGLYADDATLEDPVGTDVRRGKEAISEFYYGIGDADLSCRTTGPVRYANREIMFPFECVMQTPDGKFKTEIIDHFVLNSKYKVIAMRAFWSAETTSQVTE